MSTDGKTRSMADTTVHLGGHTRQATGTREMAAAQALPCRGPWVPLHVGGVGLVASGQREPHWFAPPIVPASSSRAAPPTAQLTTNSLDHRCKGAQTGSRWVVGEHWGLTELLRWLPASAMQNVLSQSDDEPEPQPHRKRQRNKEGLPLLPPSPQVGLAADADSSQGNAPVLGKKPGSPL